MNSRSDEFTSSECRRLLHSSNIEKAYWLFFSFIFLLLAIGIYFLANGYIPGLKAFPVDNIIPGTLAIMFGSFVSFGICWYQYKCNETRRLLLKKMMVHCVDK